MPGLSCNACDKEFLDDTDQKLHYKSEWHRYNLKRKIAGVHGVREHIFLARQSALAEEQKKLSETPLIYSCGLCGKGYRSSQAHAQHLKSKSHLARAAEEPGHHDENSVTIKPLLRHPQNGTSRKAKEYVEESDDSDESEWEEVDPEEEMISEATDSLTELKMNEHTSNGNMDEDSDVDEDIGDLDPSCCFMCDKDHKTIESCMVHMHKMHGFFIPDVEYLKDPKGFLTYLGLKVKRDFMCLYCNDRCHPFSSLEAVRKHMEAKSHCRVHYGDGDEEEEAELEEFYDYSSSYVDETGKQLILSDDTGNSVELGSGGSELIITTRNDDGRSVKTLGSREFLRYYRQKLRPTRINDVAVSAALAARYRSMGLATVQSREHMVKMKVLKAMNKSGVEVMRNKIGMKSNVIRNLPNNVPY
ncbi:PREDICTED: cytoplasmic 60S subunit biogenesis factor REI1 homolog 1-like [Nicotiana attenuata]|uniref:Cytoplasmic 60s subunit biogenesis factor rei1 -like 1 n=1 Tax=Nicotiana attenuata TaxID=49451 RepID=A0A1J6K3D4_NICAT|nr:PREDICTED: cytoplasmic 60S subunit biogenesis factor REI1 homolog 1-like [Nicotiana attenuata]OIT24565.1 cytoplasmic 60s subunit biogenesis factor rei1 -like 1 [Nicotiana attenuata]